ncbi:MAG: 50S ribosomal protein L17 [bacterium]
MRHRKNKITLDRPSAQRRSLMANLAESLILYEKIKTTEAKAKALRPFFEKLITKAKKNTLASRRDLIAVLYTENAVKKLIDEVAPKYLERQGGYTRITKLAKRQGDGASEAIISLV